VYISELLKSLETNINVYKVFSWLIIYIATPWTKDLTDDRKRVLRKQRILHYTQNKGHYNMMYNYWTFSFYSLPPLFFGFSVNSVPLYLNTYYYCSMVIRIPCDSDARIATLSLRWARTKKSKISFDLLCNTTSRWSQGNRRIFTLITTLIL